MESALTWEHATLINELTQGMEKAKQLRFHLCTISPSKEHNLLLQKILSSYEKALLILKCSGSVAQGQSVTPASRVSGSSSSIDGSPKSEELNTSFRDHHQDQQRDTPKKRKLQPTWTEQVKVNSENGLEGPTDDGYSWRKYGQKDILGAKYPRSYYRCTYRLLQNCWTTKQVQRSDADPTVFEVTYRGTHTCNQSNHSVTGIPTQSSPEKQEQNQTLLNLRANLRVETEDLDNKEMQTHFSFPACHDMENCYFPISGLVEDNHQGNYSQLFYSPATSESNYYSAPTYQMNNYGVTANLQHSRSDITEIISAHASTTNSPIGGMEFSVDPVDLDPNFPFNTSGLFT